MVTMQVNNMIEAMTIQISVKEMKIRLVNAYAPQEYDENEKKIKFWRYLDEQVFAAQTDGSGLMVTMDGNAWLGHDFLKGDPHPQNKNGDLFKKFLDRNPEIRLMNLESFCEGLITRSRKVNDKMERSIIDFVLVCDKLYPFISKFVIDEKKQFALSCYTAKKNIKYSDHNSLITYMNFHFEKSKPERRVT